MVLFNFVIDYFWFVLSFLLMLVLLPFYYWSLEHEKLEKRFGVENGTKIGNFLGMFSGWGFFITLIGIWISPQQRSPEFLTGLIFQNSSIDELTFNPPIMIISLSLIILAMYLGIKGVIDVTIKVAETHHPHEVITNGLYSKIRHPQYLSAFLAHLGISLITGAMFSLILTPFIGIYIYLISSKEEKELIKEFGKNYSDYQQQVPMFLPKLGLK